MGGIGYNLGCAIFLQCFGGLTQCASCVYNIVDQHTGAPFNFTNQIHYFTLIRCGAALVDNRQITAQLLSYSSRPHYTADIWRYNLQIFVVLTLNIAQ